MISALRVDIEARRRISERWRSSTDPAETGQGFQQDLRNMLLDDVRSILAYYADSYRWLISDAMTVSSRPPRLRGGEVRDHSRTGEHENKLPRRGRAPYGSGHHPAPVGC